MRTGKGVCSYYLHARAAASDFKSLPRPKWRIPSEATVNANQGAVALNFISPEFDVFVRF